MRNVLRVSSIATAITVTAIAGSSIAPAAVLYKTGFGNYDTQAAVGYNPNNASFTTAFATYTATGGSASGVAAGGLGEGRGDDYSTAFTSLTVTSLRFVGSLQSTANGVAIEFYNADGTRNTGATIYPDTSTDPLTQATAHTLTLSTPVTIIGSGYIVFAPYTYNYSTGAAPQISLGYSDGSGNHDVGTNDATSSVEANYGSSYPSSTARTLSSVNVPFTSNRLSLEFDGTGVPEPTSIALLAPVAMLLKRRRQD